MTSTEAPPATRSSPSASRVPMSEVSPAIVALIAIGAAIVGTSVGFAAGNAGFSYLMIGLSIVAVFLFCIFVPQERPTRPARGSTNAVLPVVALVLSCVSTSLAGIALGHASRHLIKTRGGDGERIALAALIVGYSVLAVEVAVALWLFTFFAQLNSGRS